LALERVRKAPTSSAFNAFCTRKATRSIPTSARGEFGPSTLAALRAFQLQLHDTLIIEPFIRHRM
jgi:hypothetical protein